MNRREFLKKLKEALENDLSGQVVQENINYYDQYISDEVAAGKDEQEVIDMLGDPWMLARTAIDASEMGIKQETYEQSSQERYTDENVNSAGQDFVKNMIKPIPAWKKVLFVAGIVFAIFLVIAIVTGIVSFLAPIVIPIVLVVVVLKMIGKRRG